MHAIRSTVPFLKETGLVLLLISLNGALGSGALAQSEGSGVAVRIETTLGPIRVWIDSLHAPITATNFLKYVDAHLFEGGSFFRTVHAGNQPADSIRIAVIQGGANPDSSGSFYDPIPLERTSVTGLKHVNGTISMARGAPDTASDSFFICIEDQPELDFGGRRNPDGQGFAAFGSVLSGMDVVRGIQQAASEGQRLSPPIGILRIYRE